MIELRRKNPKAIIGSGVVLLGDGRNVQLGKDVVLESGAILDMRQGGAIDLGDHTRISSGAVLSPWGGSIRMGHTCGVNHYTVIYGHGGFSAGNYVRFAVHCIAIPANHGLKDLSIPIYKQPLTCRGIHVGDDVWIGAGAILLDGICIGNRAVVAAGAVVNQPIPDGAIHGGVPARELRRRLPV